MIILKYWLICLLLHHMKGSLAKDALADDEDAQITRIMRDITGQYHPELHGDHAHRHGHVHSVESHSHSDGSGGSVQRIEVTSGGPSLALDEALKLVPPGGYIPPPPAPSPGGYYLPPPPPHPLPHDINGYANCGCVLKGQCAKEVLDYQPILLQHLKNDVRCGRTQYDLCCPNDPWPGPIDIFKPQMPCYPVEDCLVPYGEDPYDIQNYGALGPCLGLGSVRCIQPGPRPTPGPTTIVVPIYDYPTTTTPPPTTTTTTVPITLPPATPAPPPPVYEPPPPPTPIYEPPPPPTPVYEPPPPPTPIYVPPPAPVYEPPPPSTVYEEPTQTYLPPPTTPAPPPPPTYSPPVETYVPPVTTYEAPVETYVPPTPVETYTPPVATYEPPSETYAPPVATYEPPEVTYEAPVPATDYGVPAVGGGYAAPSTPYYPYRRRHGFYKGYNSRYGFPGYGGFGFRKRFGFGFYG